MGWAVTGRIQEAMAQVPLALFWCQQSRLLQTLSENFSQKEAVFFFFQLLQTAAALPVPCNPSDMSHVYVPIKVREHSLTGSRVLPDQATYKNVLQRHLLNIKDS